MILRGPSRLAASSIAAAAVLLTASVAAAQLLEEQGAYAAVDRAVAAFNGASDRASMLRAADQALDAAEGVLNAFTGPDRVRDAAAARYDAAVAQASAVRATCDNGYRCGNDNLLAYFVGIEDARARDIDAKAAVSTATAAYVEAVGTAGAAEARERAARLRRYANRMRGVRGGSTEMVSRRNALGRDAYAEYRTGRALHSRATAAHVAANRAALNALGRAAQTLSTGAERLTDDNYPGTRAAEVIRAAGALDRAAAAAGGPEVSNTGDRTDQALEGLILASRETMTVLRSHVQLVEQAARRYEQDPEPPQGPVGGQPGRPADVQSQPAGDFAGWVRQINTAIAAAEQAAADAEQAAAGSGSWFSRSSACYHARDRGVQASIRVQNLTFMGIRRPEFVPAEAGSQAWEEVSGRLDEADRRAREACASIRR